MTTTTANLFGRGDKYVPASSRSVQLTDANMHTLAAARFGQRCEIVARLHTAGATPAEVRIICGDDASVDNLSNNGGKIISTNDGPVELYVPGEGFSVSVQKLRATEPDVDVFFYATDNTGETAKFPPIKVNASEAISAAGAASVTVDKPTNTADNDLMICLVGVDSDTVEPDLTAGWTWLGGSVSAARVLAGANPTLRVAYRLASSEGASYVWGKAASSQTWAAAILTVRVQGASSEGAYGFSSFNSAVYGARNDTSTSLNLGLWLCEEMHLAVDTRFNLGASPILMILVVGAYNSSAPGDPIAQMASWSNFVRNGGGDMKGNQMLAIGSVMATAANPQLGAVKLVAAASHFQYQAASLICVPN